MSGQSVNYNHTVPRQVFRRQFTNIYCQFFWPVTDSLLFLNQRKRENRRKTGARFYIWTVCIQSRYATNRDPAPGVWIQKMLGWDGAIDGTHTSSDILSKNDQNNKHDFRFDKRQLEIYF